MARRPFLVACLLMAAVCVSGVSMAGSQAPAGQAAPAAGSATDRIAGLSAKPTLTKPEQEELALALFKQMAADPSDKPDYLVKGYNTVIEKCPDTERAHVSYWRLSNVYLQAFDPPKHAEVVRILEQFLSRYQSSTVVAMAKYPDQQLVFSPVRTLHQAYESLGQFDKIAAFYDKAAAAKARFTPYDLFDYGWALDKSSRVTDALAYYTMFLAATERRKDDFEDTRDLTESRMKELRAKK